jgi:hypothetical protein
MRKYSETPSLGKNQEWQPKSGPSPYRPPLGSSEEFPARRDVDSERATKWFDPASGARSAKSKNASPRGRRK